MGKPTRLVLLSSLGLLCFLCEAIDGGLFGHSKVHLVITNGGVPNLAVHCKSKNNDLGFHSLGPGESFYFEFKPNVLLKSTLFFCSFQWPGQFHYFDVYVQPRDDDRCRHNCLWSVGRDGMCLFNLDDGKYDICSPWNSPSSGLPLLGSLA